MDKKPARPFNKPVSDDAIFKASKEVIVKFIEAGRLSPDNFPERFSQVYNAICRTVRPDGPQ